MLMSYKLETNGLLNVGYKDLTSLSELPDGIRMLYCFHNRLTSLPELSNTLKEIQCSRNKLKYLPVLPEGIRFLDCCDNELTSLPNLPDSLNFLYCYDNPLECVIPTKFVYCQTGEWLRSYYLPYIRSYSGQRNVMINQPDMIGDLMIQVKLLDVIREEFVYLINSCELNLL